MANHHAPEGRNLRTSQNMQERYELQTGQNMREKQSIQAGIEVQNAHHMSEETDLSYKRTTEGYRMDFHCHPGLEIFQFFSGRGSLLIEDRIYNLSENSIYIINSLNLHKTYLDGDIPYYRTVLTFRPDSLTRRLNPEEVNDLLTPFYRQGNGWDNRVPVNEADFQEVVTLFEKLREEMDNGAYKSKLAEALYISQILVIINRAYRNAGEGVKRSKVGSAAGENVMKILEFIGRNITEDITMESIERELNLSRYYLCHIFKEVTGFSVFEYILNKRIAEAKRLLLESNLAITDIALGLRFCDASYFSRAFKKIVGMSPAKYRLSETGQGG